MSANLQACSFLIGRLRKEVVRLRAIAFPGHDTGPRKWLNFISGLLDTASSYLTSAQVPSIPDSEVARLIKEAEHLGENVYQLLTYVAGADSTQIPHQVVAPFQRWVSGLGITNTVFFRAEHLPNYELSRVDMRHAALLAGASHSLVDATNSIVWPALRVSVPGHAMGLLPHFAVVGHELGHAIQDRINPDLMPFNQQIMEAVNRAKDRLELEAIPFGHEQSLRVVAILGAWVNELKADAVAHHLVGPGFFFALCGFLELAGQGYGIAPTHPPTDMRRRLLFELLNQGSPSFASVFSDKTQLVLTEEMNSPNVSRCFGADLMYAELKQSLGSVDAAVCIELVPAVEAFAPKIFQAALSELQTNSADLIYTPDQFATDLDLHLESLCHLVPPIEYRDGGKATACGLSTILNVGWAALLTRVDRFPAPKGIGPTEQVAARMECLHELLLKAAELSEARQLWEEQ